MVGFSITAETQSLKLCSEQLLVQRWARPFPLWAHFPVVKNGVYRAYPWRSYWGFDGGHSSLELSSVLSDTSIPDLGPLGASRDPSHCDNQKMLPG